jgi:DNA replication protein DnaC
VANSKCELGLCDGSGWIRDKKTNQVSECRCAFERRVKALVPLRFQGAQLAEFKPAVLEPTERWLAKPDDGLLLLGGVGTGKTHLAAAIVMMLARARRRVEFLPAASLFRQIRETFVENRNESEILDGFQSKEFLCLDDIGSGALSGFERRILLEILERRLNDLRPTIITTNWGLDQIAEEIDERIGSRLSGFMRIELKGDDRRRRS